MPLVLDRYEARHPQVSGDRVVWEELDGSTWQIATWSADGGASSWVTTGVLDQSLPAASGDRIFWHGDTAGSSVRAFYTMTTTGSVPTTIALKDTYYTETPAISGDRIAWCQVPAGETISQGFTWHAGETTATQVTTGPFPVQWIDVSGDRIVWIDANGVMTKRNGEATATLLASAPLTVSDVRVSGDRIAWVQGEGSGGWNVWTAVLTSPTTLGRPAVSPTKPTHGRHAHFSAVLSPGAATLATGASTTLRLYRLETMYVTKKVHGRNRRVKVAYWHLRASARMVGSGSGATRTLSATVTPRYAGKWRAIASFSGAPGFFGSTSASRDFTVK
jgi:hypothetical protein